MKDFLRYATLLLLFQSFIVRGESKTSLNGVYSGVEIMPSAMAGMSHNDVVVLFRPDGTSLNTMKKVLISYFLLATPAIIKAQTTEESQVKEMLKTFYTAYMTNFASDTGNGLLQLRRKYCTSKCEGLFKKLVEETDADPIIKGQDSDAKYAQTLIIKKANNRPNSYTVSYSYDDYDEKGKLKKETATINLIIVKVKGVFKIDSIS